MTLSRFEFFSPLYLDDAIALLVEKGNDAFIMSGGTDLLIKRRHQIIHPKAIISLKNIKGMDRIAFNRKKGLTIGANALLADVAKHRSIRKVFPAIARAAQNTANVQIRNMGTVVGNLCNASPAADNAPALLALNAEMNIVGPEGKRMLLLEGFFVGPGLTALQPAEIVTSVFVPTPPVKSGATYLHLSARGRIDCSAANAGVFLILKGNRVSAARLFIGACGPTPLRMRKAEKKLIGHKLTEALAIQVGQLASKESKPISDVRANEDYRSKMVAVLVKRAILEAYQLAKEAK
jgi:aerobic carbon-monoxide dehydrogenase medium subunit